jgi:multidrug efflux system membrane fusion protein
VTALLNIPNRARLVLALVFTALIALQACGGKSPTDSTAPDPAASGKGKGGGGKGKGRSLDGGGPVPVVTAKVTQRDVPIDVSVVGNVEAYATISIIPQVGGQLTDVAFHEGDFVKKGQKLFTIDPRALTAQLAQIEANLARDNALMNQAQANLARDTASEANARTEAGRYAKLFDEKIVSREQVDSFKTTADTLAQSVMADRAAIDSAKAQAAADRAAIDNARVQLGFTAIPSPIDGRTGNLMFKQGNVVSPGTALVMITQVEPIYVTFAVPEATLRDVRKFMELGKLQVTATTQDGQANERGNLTFIDNNVDMTTGTIKLKGTFPNVNHHLWPGQFVNVVLRLTTRPKALVVPNQAVQSGQDGSFVYVVKPDTSVAVAKVVTGPRIDTDLVIESGLNDGDIVVTEGQLRLAPGSKVQMRGEGGRRGGGRGGDGSGGGPRGGGGADASAPAGAPAAAAPGGDGSGAGEHKRGEGRGRRDGSGFDPSKRGTNTDWKGKRRGAGTQ